MLSQEDSSAVSQVEGKAQNSMNRAERARQQETTIHDAILELKATDALQRLVRYACYDSHLSIKSIHCTAQTPETDTTIVVAAYNLSSFEKTCPLQLVKYQICFRQICT